MASLVLKSAGFDGRVIELNLGVNRFGRSPKSDVQIEHPTVSANHCEVLLADDGFGYGTAVQPTARSSVASGSRKPGFQRVRSSTWGTSSCWLSPPT